MATFQIHEDIENLVPRIQSRKPVGYKENVYGEKEKRVALKPITANYGIQEDVNCNTITNGKEIVLKETNKNYEVLENEQRVKRQCLDSMVVKFEKQENEAIVFREKDGFPNSLLNEIEYQKDIWQYHLELESMQPRPKSNYMYKQLNLTWNMRSILVDWLVSVADEYKLSEHTIHLAVNYIDRFLSQISVIREKFQLVGAAAMMIAGKIEEIYPPDPNEWAYLTGDTYTTRQLLKMEQLILKVLEFKLQPPTMITFIQHFCTEHNLDEKTMYLAMYLSELVLLEGHHYLDHMPSLLAASSVALARLTLSKKKPWPEPLKASSGYCLKVLSPVVERQNKTFRDSPLKENQAIQSKYKTDKYHRVALLKPRVLNMNELLE